jgi:hypothetical protein
LSDDIIQEEEIPFEPIDFDEFDDTETDEDADILQEED